MKKRIFRGIFLASFITLVLALGLIFGVMYGTMTEEIKNEVKNQAVYVRTAAEFFDNELSYIVRLGRDSENRLTLIDSGGTVVYDSYVPAQEMENHSDRPEFLDAINDGEGEVTRYSETLGEKTYYYIIRLDNGEYLRVACTMTSALGYVRNVTGWIVIIILGIVGVSLAIARAITGSVIRPINKLDLDDPLSNETYEELTPLLLNLEKKNKKISNQVSELRERKEEFDCITASMNEGLVVLGNGGVILSANNSAKKIFSSSGEGNYLMLCRDIDYIRAVENALSGEPSSAKIEKNERVYQLSANPVEGGKGSYAAALLIIDITDKEQSEKMRREFSANVSHELKTPLTSILGCAEIMANGIAKQEDIPRFANQIHDEAARLLTLIEDIIRLSRLDESDLNEEIKTIDLSQLCKSVLGALEERAREADVRIEFEGENAEVSGFAPVLYEMIYNLCDNAVKYNKKGGSVKIKLGKDGDKTILSVSDTGIGIAPEHQARVFERFYRVDKSHSKETGGTGLGLSIVKHAARLHDAEISLKSKEYEGTTITVTF